MGTDDTCFSCAGDARIDQLAPRETVYVSEHWRVAHSFNTVLPGWLVILARRHLLNLHELNEAEAAALGPLLHRLSLALVEVTGCVKTYLVFFAENPEFAHLHIHLVPRMADVGDDVKSTAVFELLRRPRAEWVPVEEQDRLAERIRSLVEV